MKAKLTKANKTQRLRELSIEQRNAIDLLIVGKTDQETADTIGVSRPTIWAWRRHHLLFQSELEQARGHLWRDAAEGLRGLMTKALENIGAALEKGDVRASFELLKAVGIYGSPEINRISDWRMPTLIRQAAEAQAKAEGFLEDATETLLIDLSKNDAWRHRVEEIESELWAAYGTDEPTNGAGSE
jgi:Homeodomain-like domain